MFVRQDDERQKSDPDERQRNDWIEARQLAALQGKSHEERIDTVEAVADEEIYVLDDAQGELEEERRAVCNLKQGDVRTELAGTFLQKDLRDSPNESARKHE